MCQLLLFCPEAQMVFKYVLPLLVFLVILSGILLTREAMQVCVFVFPQQKRPERHVVVENYSIIDQAQEVAEKAEEYYRQEEISLHSTSCLH